MTRPDAFDRATARVGAARTRRARGRVVEASGATLAAVLPEAVIGQVVRVGDPGRARTAEILAFRDHRILLVPDGGTEGIGPGADVRATGDVLRVNVGRALAGRVVDGLGRPMDGPPPDGLRAWPVDRPPPSVLHRQPIDRPLPVGVRAIDGLSTLGRGQRIGLFAGAGVGKSTLLEHIARGAEADMVVRCVVGERGREIREVIGDGLPEREILVAAPSDAVASVRRRAPFVATAIAEWFRDRGDHVLLLVDSLTRFARAQRELGLALGEPPTRHGYPPSVFASLPRLVERAGTAEKGSITAIYTVLVAGDDLDEPIADEARGLLDGHIVLDRDLAARGRRPAIDVVR